MKYTPKVGDQVELASPATWLGHGCDVDAVYTVTGVKVGDFGSGIGAQVVPAIQLHHQDGDQVWYDAAHFNPSVASDDGGWIKTGDRMPTNLSAEYWCWSPRWETPILLEAWARDGRTQGFCHEAGGTFHDVTHWMEAKPPKPPEPDRPVKGESS